MKLESIVQELQKNQDVEAISSDCFVDVFELAMLRSDDEGFADPSPLQIKLYSRAIRDLDIDTRESVMCRVMEFILEDKTIHIGTMYSWIFLEPEIHLAADAACFIGQSGDLSQQNLSPLLTLLRREDVSLFVRGVVAQGLIRLPKISEENRFDWIWKQTQRDFKTYFLDKIFDREDPDANSVLFLASLLESPLFPSFHDKIFAALIEAGQNVDPDSLAYWETEKKLEFPDFLIPNEMELDKFQQILFAKLEKNSRLTSELLRKLKCAWTEIL